MRTLNRVLAPLPGIALTTSALAIGVTVYEQPFDPTPVFDLEGAYSDGVPTGEWVSPDVEIDLAFSLQEGTALPCLPDFDGSGSVGFADLQRLLQAWGTCPACPEDLDFDDSVGFSDLQILLQAWGPCT